jgi:hypothetical protein
MENSHLSKSDKLTASMPINFIDSRKLKLVFMEKMAALSKQ